MTRALDHPLSRPASLVQLLDEHHLVVLGENRQRRGVFAQSLTEHLAALSDTEVIRIPGRGMTDLTSVCGTLGRIFGLRNAAGPDLTPIIEALRSPATYARHQYFLLEDADTLLDADVALFGRVVNAFMGAAAEQEHINPDVLVLQRFVFIGGDKLGAYAEDERGQFCSWLIEDGTTEFWEVASCVDRPPVLMYRLDG